MDPRGPRMRLIVCTSSFPNPAEPNKGIFNGRRVRALAEFAELAVVAPVPYFPKFVPSKMYGRFALVPGEAVLNGLAVSYPRVPVIPKVGRSLYGLLYAAALLRPMAKAIRRSRPDALLSYWAYPDGFATVLLARCFGLPVFVAGMGCDVNDPDRHFGKRWMVTWTFQHATGAFAVSRALGERIVALGVDAAKVKVVPNGLDDAYLANGASGSSADGEKRPGTTVLFCGRLSEEKDPLYLLEAARLLFARRPAARLQFVGDGPLRKKLEELAEEWHIKDRVSFVGEIRHDRVAGYMRQADVLCLTSLREGYPNVLLEALACGLPVVATSVGGVPEIVTDEDLGILVPLGQPAELAAALEKALEKPWDRQTLRQAVKGRSWRDAGREMLAFIEASSHQFDRSPSAR